MSIARTGEKGKLDQIPQEMREARRWVLWKIQSRGGQRTKVPHVPTRPRERASVTNPTTWGTFPQARGAVERGEAEGVGFVLGDGWVGIDVDECVDLATGTIDPKALELARAVDSYTERSPGRGLHVLALGMLPAGGRRRGHVEMYDRDRFFTVTGGHVEGMPTTVERRTAQLAALHAKVFGKKANGKGKAKPRPVAAPVSADDASLIEKAKRARDGDRFSRLWTGDTSLHGGDDSGADIALCNLLAFWTGRDSDRMDRLFRQSGLMRPKWNERRGATTYGERTIANAIANCGETYREPRPTARPPAPAPKTQPEAPAVTATTPPLEEADSSGASVMVTAHLTDVGNGERLVARHGTRFRWCEAWGCFLVWDGKRWAKDGEGQVVKWAKDTIKALYGEAADMADDTLRKAFYQHAIRSENDARLRGMMHLAQSEPGIPVKPEALDTNPWLLNLGNGTLDLRTAELHPHRPADLITKLAPVEYDALAECPQWRGFLDRIFEGKAELIAHLQRALGYALTGITREQCWHLLYGTGDNGKSTLLRTVIDLFGDYGTWTPTQTLLAKRYEGIENDLARLKGARLVGAVETGDGRRLAEALVKQMTGGDGITARFLYSEYFTFTPEFKLFLATNHKPEIRGTDWATWRRVRLVPFTVAIPEAEQDGELPEKLRAEFPGILSWLVDGVLAWQRDGRLGQPDAIRQATAEYRASMDVVGGFLADRCESNPRAWAKAGDLYRAYLEWCEEGKEDAVSQRKFGEALGERGYTRKPGTGGVKGWKGLTLSSYPSDPSTPLFGKSQN